MLLKSCAMPPASVPIASSFCDWRNWDSSRSRSASAFLRCGDVFDRTGHPVRPALRRRATRRRARRYQCHCRTWWCTRYSTSKCGVCAVAGTPGQRRVHRLRRRPGGSASCSTHSRRGRSGSPGSRPSSSCARGDRNSMSLVQVPVPQAFVGAGDRELVTLLGSPQRLLGAFALRSRRWSTRPDAAGWPSASRKHCARVWIQRTSPLSARRMRNSWSKRRRQPGQWSLRFVVHPLAVIRVQRDAREVTRRPA